MAPVVSVIMNCRDHSASLRQAIDSVYAQTMMDWEIVFFDNQSTDDSSVIAQSYNHKLRYFHSDVVLTLAEARNAAVKHARGRYLCFLECDDVWLPNKLEKQLKCFELEGTTTRPIGLCYSSEQDLFVGDVYEELKKDCFIPSSTVMLDRRVLEKVGHFDTKRQLIEDWDMWLRIAEHYHIAKA